MGLCESKKEGGLGIRSTKSINILLTKWLWRLGNEEGSLWRNVIASKYGLESK